MKVIVTLFWSLVIGQVAGYIATALGGVSDNPGYIALGSVGFAIVLLIMEAVLIKKEVKTN